MLNFPTSGVLVIGRIDWFGEGVRLTTREPAPNVPLDHREILDGYRGIEGEPWPCDPHSIQLQRGLLQLDKYDQAVECFRSASRARLTDLLYLGCLDTDGFNFGVLGFEVGYCKSETSSYSVIFNEIIYGRRSPLTSYARRLNENLLLPSRHEAEAVLKTCTDLIRTGVDLENSEPFEVIEMRDARPAL